MTGEIGIDSDIARVTFTTAHARACLEHRSRFSMIGTIPTLPDA